MTRKETTMQFKFIATIFALALVTGAASVSADSERNGNLHATKECSTYTGAAGDFCTFTSSNLAEIKVGSKLFYDQADGIPNCSNTTPPCPASGLLDSNVVLYVGTGDWARGRCTLDDGTGLGLCKFSDGTGDLAGFYARVTVDCRPLTGVVCRLDGTYSFGEDEQQ
jgi:hypothetical protein